MNKKILGIKLGTFLTAIACLVASFAIWMLVKYHLSSEAALLLSNLFVFHRG